MSQRNARSPQQLSVGLRSRFRSSKPRWRRRKQKGSRRVTLNRQFEHSLVRNFPRSSDNLQIRQCFGCVVSCIEANSPPIISIIKVATACRANFWATAEADGVLESGFYWPYGKPSRVLESRLHYELFIQQLELDGLLSEEATRKRPLPQSKIQDLVAALRGLNHLPNRAAQLRALRELAEFRQYEITHAVFRQAAKDFPRKSGQRSRNES